MGEVVVFTKVPERGYVKKKLQVKLPAYLVEEIYIAFLVDTLEKLGDYHPYVAYYPARKLNLIWDILGERKYIVQRGNDFRERILNMFSDFYRMGVKDMLMVGCDTPSLRKEHIDNAFKMMESNDLVMGPSHDGGFYLLGGSGVSSELFDDVVWKSPNVLERVNENAEKLGLKTALLPQLRDVDNPEDLDAVWESGELDEKGRTYSVMRKAFKRM
ncbi:MAG: TIGR04282 family arsenosugar biosynthesis glycosyltransferase [Candidatus Altiarchaeota archaeon]